MPELYEGQVADLTLLLTEVVWRKNLEDLSQRANDALQRLVAWCALQPIGQATSKRP